MRKGRERDRIYKISIIDHFHRNINKVEVGMATK